jgi:hypothetical protein
MNDRLKTWIFALLSVACCVPAGSAQRHSELATRTPVPAGSTLVVGFLGGYDRWNDDHRSVRRLVLSLRNQPGVYAESISNHRRSVAREFILRALDTNQNHRLDPEEKARARIILFGQSWGGAAAIDTARDLERLGIPVLLTVQVDSVGLHDDLIPDNVRSAVNFFQHDLFTTIHGRREIHAADPTRTAVLGNFEMSYVFRSVDESNASSIRRFFGRSHTKMELDPFVWNRVEQYITAAIAGRLP